MARRIVMWAAAVVLGLTVLAWVVSRRQPTWEHESGVCVWLVRGHLGFERLGGSLGPPGLYFEGVAWADMAWPPWPTYESFYPGGWEVVVPLRPIVLISSAHFVGAWMVGRHRCRRRLQGLCVTCGYDRLGIIGSCPECSSSQANE